MAATILQPPPPALSHDPGKSAASSPNAKKPKGPDTLPILFSNDDLSQIRKTKKFLKLIMKLIKEMEALNAEIKSTHKAKLRSRDKKKGRQ